MFRNTRRHSVTSSYFYSINCNNVNLVTADGFTADGCVHITESVGSRRELGLVANSCTHRRRRRDATKQFRPVGVGCVYWALEPLEPFGLISDYCSGLVVQQLGVVKYTLDGVCLYNHRCMFQTGTLSSFAPKFELNFAVDHV